jgi:hypothetical protein
MTLKRQTARRTFRLHLVEVLESRFVLADRDWVGAAGGNFGTAGNWTGGSVPTISDVALISGGSVVIDNNGYQAKVLGTSGTSSLNISGAASPPSTKTLEFKDEFKVTAGTTTINNTIGGTGQMKEISDGTVRVEDGGTLTLNNAIQLIASHLRVGGYEDGTLRINSGAFANHSDAVLGGADSKEGQIVLRGAGEMIVGSSALARLTVNSIEDYPRTGDSLEIPGGKGKVDAKLAKIVVNADVRLQRFWNEAFSVEQSWVSAGGDFLVASLSAKSSYIDTSGSIFVDAAIKNTLDASRLESSFGAIQLGGEFWITGSSEVTSGRMGGIAQNIILRGGPRVWLQEGSTMRAGSGVGAVGDIIHINHSFFSVRAQ